MKRRKQVLSWPWFVVIVTAIGAPLCCKKAIPPAQPQTATASVERPDAESTSPAKSAFTVPGTEAEVPVGPLAWTEVGAATAVPAHWFLAVAPGADPGMAAACAAGDLENVPMTLAVLEVRWDRLALAGSPVGALEMGRVADGDAGGQTLHDLRTALAALGAINHSLGRQGCRPWATMASYPPNDLQASWRQREATAPSIHPPLLLAVDGRVPMETLMQVAHAAVASGFVIGGVWVDDGDPAPLPQDEGPAEPGDVVWVRVGAVEWAVLDSGQADARGVDQAPARWSSTPLEGPLAREQGVPQGVVLAGGGASMGQVLTAQDRLVDLGAACVELRPAENSGNLVLSLTDDPGSTRTLRWDDTVAVLPWSTVRSSTPARERPFGRLITGTRCPRYMPRPASLARQQVESEARTLLEEAMGSAARGGDVQRVVSDLERIREQRPDLAQIATARGDAADRADVSLAVEDDSHVYAFLQGRGECVQGCSHHDVSLFTSDAAGQVDDLGCAAVERAGMLSRNAGLEDALSHLGEEGFAYIPPELAGPSLCLSLCGGEAFRQCILEERQDTEQRARFQVGLEFTVAPDGTFSGVHASDPDLAGSEVEACLVEALRGYEVEPFPATYARHVQFEWTLIKGRRVVCPGCHRAKRARVMPHVTLVELSGSDDAALRETISDSAAGLGRCLGPRSEVELTWTVQPHGSFTDPVVVSGAEGKAATCVADEVRSWWHPMDGGAEVRARFGATGLPHDLGCRR